MLDDITISDAICNELTNIRTARAVLTEALHYIEDRNRRSGLPAMAEHIGILLAATADYLQRVTKGLEKLNTELCPPKPSTTDKAEGGDT